MSLRAIVGPATPSNLAAVIQRLARNHESAAAGLQALLDDGTLAVSDLIALHAEDDPQAILGSMLTQPLGGAQAALWPPVADAPEIEESLVAAAVARLTALGHRVLQAVVRIPSPPSIAAFERAGFVYVTDLTFMDRDLAPSDANPVATRLTLTPAASDDLAFAERIEQTYVDSLDLPELNDTRSASEILASCRVTAKVEPPLWWFANFEANRVGVLQLAPADEEGDFELLYMGLVPQARGQGLGRELAQCAVSIAAALGGTRLHLSHDVRNRSAGRAYTQLGFRETKRRAVWLKISRAPGHDSQSLRKSHSESS
jgi:RimJ/RimL family protein N-acetyltransferase